MLKITGIVMILTSAAALGFGRSYELSLREKSLEEIQLMIRWLKGEICSHHASLHDAFLDVSVRMNGKYREFLTKTAETMENSSGIRFAEIFGNCAREILGELPLSEKEWELFLSLGEKLGYLDLEMQKRQLEFLEEELHCSMNDLRAEIPAKKKVYQSLGILGGILLAILVW